MRTLYTDASFDWKHTDETDENVVRGKIAVSDGESLQRIERVAVGRVEGLRQYINIFELVAIARAVEMESLDPNRDTNLRILTDSRVAMLWAGSGKIKGKVRTKAHEAALEYLRRARIQHGGIITFHHVGRKENPAGHLLAEMLERVRPHE